MLALLAPLSAQADHYAKVNDVRVGEDGVVQVWTSILSDYGDTPEVSDYEHVEVSFGEANTFSGDELQVQAFSESGVPTDFVLIIPGYEGFGINNAEAAAQGAGMFQTGYVNEETDTALVLLYGDGVLPHDGNAAELAATFREDDGIMRAARPYMLAALDEAIRYFDDLGPGRRRIIVLVGTGLDVQLAEASMVQADTTDFEAARQRVLRSHQNILRAYMDELNAVGARVHSVGYNPSRPDYLEVLRVLARKTRGTFRAVDNIGDLAPSGTDVSGSVFEAVGEEVQRELVLTPAFEAEGGKDYEVWVNVRFYGDDANRVLADISTRPFSVHVDERDTKINPIPYLIAIGVILVVVFLLLVVAYVTSKKLKAKNQHFDEIQRLKGIIALGAIYCQTCYRPMEAGWQQCLFCASGMAPLEEKPQPMLDAEEAQTQLDELEGRTEPEEQLVVGTAGAAAALAAQQGKRQCPTCFRVMENDWKQCLFCAASMAPLPMEEPVVIQQEQAPAYGYYQGGQPAQQGPAAAPQQEQQGAGGPASVALSPGIGACPQCNRPVPPEWTECLYCKAGV